MTLIVRSRRTAINSLLVLISCAALISFVSYVRRDVNVKLQSRNGQADDGRWAEEQVMIYKTLRLDGNSIQEQTTSKDKKSKPTASEHNLQAKVELSEKMIWSSGNNNTTDKPVKSKSPTISVKKLPTKVVRKPKKTIRTCKAPVNHFAMTLTERTGSRVLFTVLARYVLKNKLTLISPTSGTFIDWGTPRHTAWDIGPGNADVSDVLITRARYNSKIFSTHLNEDTRWIVPVRDAESWMKSAVNYYPVARGKTVEEVVNSSLMYLKRNDSTGINTWFHNPQLQWLGLPAKDITNIAAIKAHIKNIAAKVELSMPIDQFDAALVVLRRRLCWSYPDILYPKHGWTSLSRHKTINLQTRYKLLSENYNNGDQLLYDELNLMWVKSPEIDKANFAGEVIHFSSLNMNVSKSICPEVLQRKTTVQIEETKWHPKFNITSSLCQSLRLPEKELSSRVSKWALGDRYTDVT